MSDEEANLVEEEEEEMGEDNEQVDEDNDMEEDTPEPNGDEGNTDEAPPAEDEEAGENVEDEELNDVDEVVGEENSVQTRPATATSVKAVGFVDANDEDVEGEEGEEGEEAPKQKGFISRAVAGMWVSTDMLGEGTDTQTIMKTTMRELILYSCFLFVIVYATFSQYSQDFYLLRSRLEALFGDQFKLTHTRGFWDFAEGPLMEGLYWEEMYNKGRKESQVVCPMGEPATAPCQVPPTDRNVMYENRLLGVPRIRQLRVGNSSCKVNENFKKAIRTCFAPYSPGLEDKAPFRREHRKYSAESAWIYQSADELEGSDYTGVLTTYSGAGSVQPLHYMFNESKAILAEIKHNLWIDQGTRFVCIDFTVYNANINLFAVVKLAFEFPATGGILPTQEIQIVKLLKYKDTSDYFNLATELIFCMFILYYIIEESIEIHQHGMAYFRNFWNLLDVIVISTSVTQILLSIYVIDSVNKVLVILLEAPFTFSEFSTLSGISKTLTYLSGFNVFVAWIKVFKYLSFNKTMTQLSGTLEKASGDLGGFSIMFLIIFFAFAQLGYLLFGTQVQDFMDIRSAIFTLFRTVLGDFNFVVIEQADYLWGPVYFLSYIFFVFFVLLNMFLAIINDTYGEVKAELAEKKPEFQMADFFKVGVNNVKGYAGIQDRALDVENAIKRAAEDDGLVSYMELRENLKASNFSDLEVDLFFNLFQEDPAMMGILIDDDEAEEKELEEERRKAMESMMAEDDESSGTESESSDSDDDDDLSKSQMSSRPLSGKRARQQRSARIMASANGNKAVDSNKFYALQERVGRMEMSIGPIVSKIDSVLERLDDMKRAKRKKKETLNKLVNNIEDNNELNDSEKRQQIQQMVSQFDMSRPNTSGFMM